MNFVPFKLQTKRREKKEVINLNKMEEEERALINLINSTWEEMALLQNGVKWRRREEGAQPFQAACSSFPSDTWGQVGLENGVQLTLQPPFGRGLLTGVLTPVSTPEGLGVK